MKLVKIKTLGKDGKTYYPIYLVLDIEVNGALVFNPVRIYTHKEDAKGFNTLSMASSYYPECAKIGDYIRYLQTNDEKYLHTAKEENNKK